MKFKYPSFILLAFIALLNSSCVDNPFGLSREGAASSPVFFFKNEADVSNPAPLLQREIIRQSILCAYRDRFGAVCRDQVLGVDGPSKNAIELATTVTSSDSGQLAVQLADSQEKEVWQAAFSNESYLTLLSTAESAAFTELPKPDIELSKNKSRNTSVPAGTEADSPLLPDLFETLRKAHAAHAVNPTPESFEVLIRGYANLGRRQSHLWSAAYKVYQARSLVYAQTFVRTHPESAQALLLRAYALGMVGEHALALNDISAAQKLDADLQPEWLEPLMLMLNFKTDRLVELANAPTPFRSTCALMAMSTLEYNPFDSRIFGAYKKIILKDPYDLRTLAQLSDAGGVGAMHQTTTDALDQMAQMIRDEIPKHSLLPSDLSEALPPVPPQAPKSFLEAMFSCRPMNDWTALSSLPNLYQALQDETASGKETGEPSLAAFGNLLRENAFNAIVWRQHFMKDKWCVEIKDFTEEAAPYIDGHPLQKLLEAASAKNQGQTEKFTNLLKEVNLGDLPAGAHLFFTHYLMNGKQYGAQTGRQVKDRYLQTLDDTHRDLQRQIALTTDEKTKAAIAARILEISPQSPYGLSELLAVAPDWEERVERMEEEPCSEVAQTIAYRYRDAKQYEKAIPYYKKALEEIEEIYVYQRLAKCYLETGDLDAWLGIMEYTLTLPDYGLRHARVCCDIAEELMMRGQVERARPYAERAAQSGAGWAIGTAAECAYVAGDQARCEELLRMNYERYYKSQAALWDYTWLSLYNVSTNSVWFQRVTEDARAVLAEEMPKEKVDAVYSAYYQWMDGKYDRAISLYDRASRASYDLLQALVLRDKGDMDAYRKKMASSITGHANSTRGSDIHVIEVIKLMEQYDRDGGHLDKLCADFIALEDNTRVYKAFHYFFAGKYLELIGEEERAVKMYYRGIGPGQESGWISFCPYFELKRRGLDPFARYSPGFDL